MYVIYGTVTQCGEKHQQNTRSHHTKKKKKSVCFSQNRSFNDGDSMQNADPHVKASRLASVRCKYMGSRVCAALIFFHAAFVTA